MNSSIIIKKIGTATDKGNATLQLTLKKGLRKDPRTILMLCDAEDTKDLKEGQDISDLIPSAFTIRESKWDVVDGDGVVKEAVSYWMES